MDEISATQFYLFNLKRRVLFKFALNVKDSQKQRIRMMELKEKATDLYIKNLQMRYLSIWKKNILFPSQKLKSDVQHFYNVALIKKAFDSFYLAFSRDYKLNHIYNQYVVNRKRLKMITIFKNWQVNAKELSLKRAQFNMQVRLQKDMLKSTFVCILQKFRTLSKNINKLAEQDNSNSKLIQSAFTQIKSAYKSNSIQKKQDQDALSFFTTQMQQNSLKYIVNKILSCVQNADEAELDRFLQQQKSAFLAQKRQKRLRKLSGFKSEWAKNAEGVGVQNTLQKFMAERDSQMEFGNKVDLEDEFQIQKEEINIVQRQIQPVEMSADYMRNAQKYLNFEQEELYTNIQNPIKKRTAPIMRTSESSIQQMETELKQQYQQQMKSQIPNTNLQKPPRKQPIMNIEQIREMQENPKVMTQATLPETQNSHTLQLVQMQIQQYQEQKKQMQILISQAQSIEKQMGSYEMNEDNKYSIQMQIIRDTEQYEKVKEQIKQLDKELEKMKRSLIQYQQKAK